jgi:hypothetical protein
MYLLIVSLEHKTVQLVKIYRVLDALKHAASLRRAAKKLCQRRNAEDNVLFCEYTNSTCSDLDRLHRGHLHMRRIDKSREDIWAVVCGSKYSAEQLAELTD